MSEILFLVLMAGVFGAATAFAASFIFLVRKKPFWRRALTVAMLAALVASAGAMGLTHYYILMGNFSEMSQVMPVVSLTVAGEIIAVIGLWGLGKLWERRWAADEGGE